IARWMNHARRSMTIRRPRKPGTTPEADHQPRVRIDPVLPTRTGNLCSLLPDTRQLGSKCRGPDTIFNMLARAGLLVDLTRVPDHLAIVDWIQDQIGDPLLVPQ